MSRVIEEKEMIRPVTDGIFSTSSEATYEMATVKDEVTKVRVKEIEQPEKPSNATKDLTPSVVNKE